MARLDGVSRADLFDALRDAEGKKPTQRLMVAVLYKSGPSVPMIADWFDLRVPTVYRWFDRMESEPLSEAVRDRRPPGRPPRLSEGQVEEFMSLVEDGFGGLDGDAPPVESIRRLIRDEFGVDYSTRHVRRLMNEHGIGR